MEGDDTVEEVGEVALSDAVYHEIAVIFKGEPARPVTHHEPSEALVQITTRSEMDSLDFATPEILDLLFETMRHPDHHL